VGVLVVDDVAVHRTALAELLSREPAIGAVLTASGISEALHALDGVPWIVVLDMGMRDSLSALRSLVPAAPVIALGLGR
jgi:DNA-binding NarL/FixJ family response regulator